MEEKISLELNTNELLLLKQLLSLGIQYIGPVVQAGQGKMIIMAGLKLEEKINNLTTIENK